MDEKSQGVSVVGRLISPGLVFGFRLHLDLAACRRIELSARQLVEQALRGHRVGDLDDAVLDELAGRVPQLGHQTLVEIGRGLRVLRENLDLGRGEAGVHALHWAPRRLQIIVHARAVDGAVHADPLRLHARVLAHLANTPRHLQRLGLGQFKLLVDLDHVLAERSPVLPHEHPRLAVRMFLRGPRLPPGRKAVASYGHHRVVVALKRNVHARHRHRVGERKLALDLVEERLRDDDDVGALLRKGTASERVVSPGIEPARVRDDPVDTRLRLETRVDHLVLDDVLGLHAVEPHDVPSSPALPRDAVVQIEVAPAVLGLATHTARTVLVLGVECREDLELL